MNLKKAPPHGSSREEGEGLQNHEFALCDWKESNKFTNNLQASISSRGISVHRYKRPSPKNNADNLKKRSEGDIQGWSVLSRRRFRRFLMDYREPQGWFNYSLTLTVPGPLLAPSGYKELWRRFYMRLSASRIPFLMVWRAEVQKRGALHWHCILSLQEESYKNVFFLKWWDCISDLGAFEGHVLKSGDVISGSSRMALSGAHGHSVDLQPEKDGDCWWRYLCDHASKAKQEQIGQDIGRHWGIVGRKYAVPSVSDFVCRLSDDQAVKLDRFLRRLRTPRVKNERDPFGFSLGWSPKMSRYGRSDYFGHQSSVKRFLLHIGAVLG